MRFIIKYIVLALSFTFLISCNSGYNKKNGKWTWKYYHGGNFKFEHGKIDSINHEKFTIISDNYGKDDKHVFYETLLISKANPKTFKVIARGYSKDDKRVFLDDEIVIFADPKSFKLLEFPYSKDKANVFCGTLPLNLQKNEIDEFKVTNKEMSGMKSSVVLSHFIEFNPEYKWLDSLNINGIIIGEWGTGRTKKKEFKGFKELKNRTQTRYK